MAKPKRRIAGRVVALIVVLLAAFVAAVARAMGASWQQIVWGTLGFLALSLMAEFIAWLVTGGPLRLEKRPSQDADRRRDRPE